MTPNQRDRLYVRLGKNRRDRKLAACTSADLERGVNVSALIKQLLYNYYTGAPLPTHASAPQPQADDQARQAALSARLRRLSFDALKGT